MAAGPPGPRCRRVPTLTDRIPLSEPCLAGNEGRYLQECIETGYVSSVGPFVERFEREFAAWIGAPHAVAVSSGTAALHIALLVAGVKPGDLVAVSMLTFIASVNAVVYAGGVPVLVDSETETWNADGARLYDWVASRARKGAPLPVAVEAVHVLGHPAQLEPFLALREEFGIMLIEDAAESLGAEADISGRCRKVGTVGNIGCFSFNGNKVITSGGGGMIVCDDPEVAHRARHLSTQAKMPGRAYQHDAIGFNYRLTNIAAAVGLAQLEQLDGFLEKKRNIALQYDESLETVAVELPPRVHWARSSSWLYSILLESPERARSLLGALNEASIDARPLWISAASQKPYRRAETIGFEVAADLSARGISLPSSVALRSTQQDRVIEQIRTCVSARRH